MLSDTMPSQPGEASVVTLTRAYGEELHRFRCIEDQLVELLNSAIEVRQSLNKLSSRLGEEQQIAIEAGMPQLLVACLSDLERFRSEEAKMSMPMPTERLHG